MPPVDTKPVVHISGMEVNYSPRVMKRDMKLIIRRRPYYLIITASSLIDPDAVKFKVMLKGFDSDWKHPAAER